MSGLAGIRRIRAAPVVLADCPFPELSVASRVLVSDLYAIDEPDYIAEVVFGPQQVVATTECSPTARIVRLIARDELPMVTDSASLWIGLAPAELFPSESVGQGLPRDAAEVALACAGLLAAIDAKHHERRRGFGEDLPDLGQEIVLADGRMATVTGIDGKRHLVHARLDGGEEIVGPLPDLWGLSAWMGLPDTIDPPTPRETRAQPRGRHSRKG